MSAAFTWHQDVASNCSGWACNVLLPEVLKVFSEPRIEACVQNLSVHWQGSGRQLAERYKDVHRTLEQQPSQLRQQVSPTGEGNEVKESSPVRAAHGWFLG